MANLDTSSPNGIRQFIQQYNADTAALKNAISQFEKMPLVRNMMNVPGVGPILQGVKGEVLSAIDSVPPTAPSSAPVTTSDLEQRVNNL
jgi:hypothetical protein